MSITVLTPEHFTLLTKFCDECAALGWHNNSSIKAMKFREVYLKGGAYLGIIENDKLISVAGYAPFPQLHDNAWKIFYRSATLPGKVINTGLHRGTGPRGRMYIDNFIKLCPSEHLYVTTNIENNSYDNILRYNKSLELESKLPDAYIHKVCEITLFNTLQAVWKLDIDAYKRRTHRDNV